jgi:hypothetical protein
VAAVGTVRDLPEVGDLEQPKLVFVFDEAHLLFDDCPPALQQRIEQVVRLIRSKGVGVYFCSQNPDDVPGEMLGQLGNRIQHALRAYTPRDMKSVKTAAETFVPNPKIDVARAISELGVGEALVSTLQDKGIPMPVERAWICPPRCRMGAITPEERARCARAARSARSTTRRSTASRPRNAGQRAGRRRSRAGDAPRRSARCGPAAPPARGPPESAARWTNSCGAPSAGRRRSRPRRSPPRAPSPRAGPADRARRPRQPVRRPKR